MTITEQVAKNIIKKLLKGEDYRIEVVTLINAEFLQFAIDFFKHIVDAKLKSNVKRPRIESYRKDTWRRKNIGRGWEEKIRYHKGVRQNENRNQEQIYR